jgi:glutamate/aspartate transport system substrate-binding protein
MRFTFILLFLLTVFDGYGASAQPGGGRLQTIVATSTIKIAYRVDAKPFSFVVSGTDPAGYTVDICKYVAKWIARQHDIPGLRIEWIPVTTETRFDAVTQGQVDLECGASTVTLERMRLVDFSNYVFVESTGLAVRNNVIRSLKDVANRKIAVVAGTTNEEAINLQNRRRKLNAIIVPMKDRGEAIAALERGEVDALASDKVLLVGSQFKAENGLKLLPEDLSIEPYAIALPRVDWELRLAVNSALSELYRSPDIRKTFDRWFLGIGLQPGILLNSAYILGTIAEH